MHNPGLRLITAAIVISLPMTGCSADVHLKSASPAALPVFLVGCHETSDHKTREVWAHTPAKGGTGFLEGEGFRLTNKGYLPSETMLITQRENGLAFSAKPGGQTETIFLQTHPKSDTTNEVSFSNPDHDYPQLITYVHGKNFLLARVSMNDGSRPMEWKFIPCSAG